MEGVQIAGDSEAIPLGRRTWLLLIQKVSLSWLLRGGRAKTCPSFSLY
jgi:hypothetical protein